MAIVVEHDKRKQEILQKSLDVFIEEGYEDATSRKLPTAAELPAPPFIFILRTNTKSFWEA